MNALERPRQRTRFDTVGKPRRRVDGRAKVAGQTRFADDLSLPRMLHMRLLRSTDLFVIPEPLCSFRISPTSWSSRIGMAQYRDYVNFVQLTRRESHGALHKVDLSVAAVRTMVTFLGRIFFFKVLV